MGLIAVTALAENAAEMLDGVVAELQSGGIEIEHRPSAHPDSATAGELLRDAGLGWACGLLTIDLLDDGLPAEVVAAPVFEGEDEPVYRSVIVARRSAASELADLVGARLVVNERESWSGHWALAIHLADHGFTADSFASVERSGSHRHSLAAVARGDADLAAIDHTLWAHLGSEPWASGLQVIDCTLDWPAPPFVVNTRLERDKRFQLVAALPTTDVGSVRGLRRLVPATRASYTALAEARAAVQRLI